MDHSASEFHRQRLPTAVTAALALALNADRIPGQAREFAFTPLGGAYNRVSADATAFVHRMMSSCWNTQSLRIRPNRPPVHAPELNGLARSANSSMGTALAARTRTSPTLS